VCATLLRDRPLLERTNVPWARLQPATSPNFSGHGKKGMSMRSNSTPLVQFPIGCGPGDTLVLTRLSETMESNLWRSDLATGELKQLTYGVDDWLSDCTPDGKSFVYVGQSPDDNVPHLFKLPIEGGAPIELARGNISSLKVSPDGRSVAYFRLDGEGPSWRRMFVVQELQGGSPQKEIEDKRDSDCIGWSPDGRALTFLVTEGNSRSLYMQPLSGGKAVRLLHFDGEPSWITSYRWSADGKKVAVTRSSYRNTDVIRFSRVLPNKGLNPASQ
jgi:Tol biopolymer transport system component